MQQPTVSIIVPVYNARQTIRRCVDSVLRQDFPDFELLLVDDGSTDGSGALCDEYARRDPRVRVMHRENGGVSAARNDALDRARGVFLQFLDSDDWLTPDAAKLLVRTAREHSCDLVIADFYRVSGDWVSHKGGIDDTAVMSREVFASHMMENPAAYYYGVLWNKLYRRDIVERHRLRMDAGIRWCEDFLFNLEYVLHARTFVALRAPVYYYVRTKGSLVAQSATLPNVIRTKLRLFAYYNDFYKHVLDERDYEKNRLQVYRFLLDAAGDGVVVPGLTKLGEERTPVGRQAAAAEGPLGDAYRARKLLDRCLETAALQHDLTVQDIRLLLCLHAMGGTGSRRELADFAGVSRVALARLLQRLTARELIRTEEVRGEDGERLLRAEFLAAARGVLADAADARDDYDRARLAGLSPEEAAQCRALSGRLQDNMRRALQ